LRVWQPSSLNTIIDSVALINVDMKASGISEDLKEEEIVVE
jgi:hypothetical protein